jgi:hypothetical protein
MAGSLLACSKPGSVRPPCDAQYVDIPQDTSDLSTLFETQEKQFTLMKEINSKLEGHLAKKV